MVAEVLPGSGVLALFALLLCLLLVIFARPIAAFLNVFDEPDGRRKRHVQKTPLIGGIAILLPFLLWAFVVFVWHGASDKPFLLAMMSCCSAAGLIGFADDQSEIGPLSRMAGLVIVLCMGLIIDAQLLIHQLNWGSFTPTPIGTWPCFLLMAITAAGLVNAINMADGQNGIVLGMYVIWAACMTITSINTVAAVSMVLLVLSSVVLCFNLAGKLFLGDAGTYGVTFAFGLLAAAIHAKGYATLETIIVWFFIPVADCVRLMISRALNGGSPMNGDRDHFHHRLENKFGRQGGLAIYWVAVALPSLIATLEPKFSLAILILLAAFFSSLQLFLRVNLKQKMAINAKRVTILSS
jgi:UDP-GlcNAc:undecaprenyl-phosphate GlcNAc-1-phosphate transferase